MKQIPNQLHWHQDNSEDQKIFNRVNQIRKKYRNLATMKQSIQNTNPKEYVQEQKITQKHHQAHKLNQTNQQSEKNNKNNQDLEENIESRPISRRTKIGMITQKQSKMIQKSVIQQTNCNPFFDQKNTKQSHFENQLSSLNTIRQISSKSETKLFLDVLIQQILLDQKFRKAKQCLRQKADPNKMQEIINYLRARQVLLDEVTIKQKFNIGSAQYNPFSQIINMSYQQICECWFQSEDHWQFSIRNKFSLSNLQGEGFINLFLPFQKVSISHFVSVLNYMNNFHLRNRDLIVIFQRINLNSIQIKVSQFLKEICI